MKTKYNKPILTLFFVVFLVGCSSSGNLLKDDGYLGEYDEAREERIREIEETKWMEPPEIQKVMEIEADNLREKRTIHKSPDLLDLILGGFFSD